MSQAASKSLNSFDRRTFIGGSDARIIMGSDEAALLRLWREKRGEAEPAGTTRLQAISAATIALIISRILCSTSPPPSP